MTALLRKELRALLPLLVLVLAIQAGMDLAYVPITERLDEVSWVSLDSDVLPGKGHNQAFVLLILGLIAAYSAFPREHDERTIEFLYSLPVSRRQIFAAKALAGLAVLGFGLAVRQGALWLLQLPNTQSFSGEQFQLKIALGLGSLQLVYAAVIYGWGLLFSFMRKFGLIFVAMLGWVMIFLEEQLPQLAPLDPTNLLELEYRGASLAIPWTEVALQLLLAACAVALAYALWMGLAERVMEAYVRVHSGGVAIGCCGTLLVVTIVGSFGIYVVVSAAEDQPDDPVTYVSWESVDATTEHYTFRYPANLRGRALRLIARSDEAYRAVRDHLGASSGERIVVDLTEVSADHAGIAAWKKIRMGLVGEEDDAYYLRVFHHETVHAFQFKESQRRMGENGRATRFFAEGLAEYVAFELVSAPEERRRARQVALAVWKRQNVRFRDLADGDAWRERHDTNQVYSLGETWSAALARACGPAAPGNVLRAMAREGAPRDLDPVAFWQDTLQAAGYTLEGVVAEWTRLMHELEAEEAEFLRALPSMGGGVADHDDEEVTIIGSLDRDPYPGVSYRLRVRSNAGASDTEILGFRGEVDEGDPARVVFSVPRSVLHGRTFEFQFGQRVSEGVWPYYEEWQTAAIPR